MPVRSERMNPEALALVVALLLLWAALDIAVTAVQERRND